MGGIIAEDSYYKRLRAFLNASNSETDRGRTLVAASLIEEMLGEILRSFLLENAATKKMFDAPNAPLSTFSAMASASCALSLISNEEFRDIELIRKIRNEFAHNLLCSFDDGKIRGWAESLKVGMSTLDALENDHESYVNDARQRFNMVTVSLVTSLYNRAHYVRKERIKRRKWPA